MYSWKNYFLSAAAFLVAVGILTFAGPFTSRVEGQASAVARDVRVINADSEAVPVKSPGQQLEFVGSAAFADGLNAVFTVPDGHKFVLTDAFFVHNIVNSVGIHGANLVRGFGTCAGGQDLLRAFVEGNDNVVFHFQTGFEFAAGQRVCYATGGSGVDAVQFTLVGYLTPIAP